MPQPRSVNANDSSSIASQYVTNDSIFYRKSWLKFLLFSIVLMESIWFNRFNVTSWPQVIGYWNENTMARHSIASGQLQWNYNRKTRIGSRIQSFGRNTIKLNSANMGRQQQSKWWFFSVSKIPIWSISVYGSSWTCVTFSMAKTMVGCILVICWNST